MPARKDIECPGDIILHRCQILIGMTLTWVVTMPGEMPINATISQSTDGDIILNEHFLAYRTALGHNFIRSELQLTIFVGISTDQVRLECFNVNTSGSLFVYVTINSARESFQNLVYSVIILFLYIAPLSPTDFRIDRENHGILETTVTLTWVPPQGVGPSAIVDNYTISISPAPPNHSARITIVDATSNVSLTQNEVYNLSLIATNCFGESQPNILSNIEISECKH